MNDPEPAAFQMSVEYYVIARFQTTNMPPKPPIKIKDQVERQRRLLLAIPAINGKETSNIHGTAYHLILRHEGL